jgi:hypothetical protein
MSARRNQVSKRLDRVLRTQWVGAVLLGIGAAAFLLGVGLIFLTIHYTPEELLVRVRDKPWTHDVFLILPAAEHYRTLGGVGILVGLGLFGLGNFVREDHWWFR